MDDRRADHQFTAADRDLNRVDRDDAKAERVADRDHSGKRRLRKYVVVTESDQVEVPVQVEEVEVDGIEDGRSAALAPDQRRYVFEGPGICPGPPHARSRYESLVTCSVIIDESL